MISRRRFLILLGGAGAVGAWWAGRKAAPHVARRTSWALGSNVRVTVLSEDPRGAEESATAALAEIEMVDRVMSIFRPDSEVHRLNRDGSLDAPHPCLVEILDRARRMSERSDGAFDVTVQPLWEIHAEARRAGGLPSEAAMDAARAKVDWRKLEATPDSIRLLAPGMAVTLNGIAQGFAADRAAEALRARGIRHALVDAGELAPLGSKGGGEPWTVGIQHPREPGAFIALARLDGRCLATSGDYATAFTADFSRNHLFDPGTGRSPAHFSSVTVAAPTGTDADALSTAIFVSGIDRGLSLLTPGADAFLVLKDGRTVSTRGFPEVS